MRLKECLSTDVPLSFPDFSLPFILDTDASDEALGGVLSQVVNGAERPVAFASRTLSKQERNYCTTRKELLAMAYFARYFKHYLQGKKFTFRVDHASIQWILNFKDPDQQLARWLDVLNTFDFDVCFRKGVEHVNADAMSRRTMCSKPCGQCTRMLKVSRVVSQNDGWLTTFTLQEIADMQKADHVLKSLYQAKIKGLKESWSDFESATCSPNAKRYHAAWDQIVFEDNVLKNVWYSNDAKHKKKLLIVPKKLQDAVLQQTHASRFQDCALTVEGKRMVVIVRPHSNRCRVVMSWNVSPLI